MNLFPVFGFWYKTPLPNRFHDTFFKIVVFLISLPKLPRILIGACWRQPPRNTKTKFTKKPKLFGFLGVEKPNYLVFGGLKNQTAWFFEGRKTKTVWFLEGRKTKTVWVVGGAKAKRKACAVPSPWFRALRVTFGAGGPVCDWALALGGRVGDLAAAYVPLECLRSSCHLLG